MTNGRKSAIDGGKNRGPPQRRNGRSRERKETKRNGRKK